MCCLVRRLPLNHTRGPSLIRTLLPDYLHCLVCETCAVETISPQMLSETSCLARYHEDHALGHLQSSIHVDTFAISLRA